MDFDGLNASAFLVIRPMMTGIVLGRRFLVDTTMIDVAL